jgi:hypothetical protein
VKAVRHALRAPVTKEEDGVYEASLPRQDLHITRHSIPIGGAFDQDTELDFLPSSNGPTMVMGELAATEREEARLVPALAKTSITITAIHNHITELSPEIEWIHFSASGNAVSIARAIRRVLQRTTGTQFPVKAGGESTGLPRHALAKILGGQATVDDGVVNVSIDRGDRFSMGGQTVPPDFGVNALVYFEQLKQQHTSATTGEVCLLASEIQPVISACSPRPGSP